MMGSHDNVFICNYTFLNLILSSSFSIHLLQKIFSSAICAPFESFEVASGQQCGFQLFFTAGSLNHFQTCGHENNAVIFCLSGTGRQWLSQVVARTLGKDPNSENGRGRQQDGSSVIFNNTVVYNQVQVQIQIRVQKLRGTQGPKPTMN